MASFYTCCSPNGSLAGIFFPPKKTNLLEVFNKPLPIIATFFKLLPTVVVLLVPQRPNYLLGFWLSTWLICYNRLCLYSGSCFGSGISFAFHQWAAQTDYRNQFGNSNLALSDFKPTYQAVSRVTAQGSPLMSYWNKLQKPIWRLRFSSK